MFVISLNQDKINLHFEKKEARNSTVIMDNTTNHNNMNHLCQRSTPKQKRQQ